jgi:hypothetical protein
MAIAFPAESADTGPRGTGFWSMARSCKSGLAGVAGRRSLLGSLPLRERNSTSVKRS